MLRVQTRLRLCESYVWQQLELWFELPRRRSVIPLVIEK